MGVKSGILPPPVSSAVVEHYCDHEWARHLDDVMIRRTSWRHYHHDHLEIAGRTAHWMASRLGWDECKTQAEIARYRQLVGAVGISTSPHVEMSNGHPVSASTVGAHSSSGALGHPQEGLT